LLDWQFRKSRFAEAAGNGRKKPQIKAENGD